MGMIWGCIAACLNSFDAHRGLTSGCSPEGAQAFSQVDVRFKV